MSGYNDWKLILKNFKEEDILEWLEVSVSVIGNRMVNQARKNVFGTYIADDDHYDYYVVQWTGLPYAAEKSEVIELVRNQFTVQKGEMICAGV